MLILVINSELLENNDVESGLSALDKVNLHRHIASLSNLLSGFEFEKNNRENRKFIENIVVNNSFQIITCDEVNNTPEFIKNNPSLIAFDLIVVNVFKAEFFYNFKNHSLECKSVKLFGKSLID